MLAHTKGGVIIHHYGSAKLFPVQIPLVFLTAWLAERLRGFKAERVFQDGDANPQLLAGMLGQQILTGWNEDKRRIFKKITTIKKKEILNPDWLEYAEWIYLYLINYK